MINPLALAAVCSLAAAGAAAAATAAVVRRKFAAQAVKSGSRELRALGDLAQSFGASGAQTESILAALVAILAKYLEADLVAFLLPDASGTELVVQPGTYGVKDKEDMFYRIPIASDEHSSVRVFKSGKPFLTGDAQNDPDVISRYAKLWDIRSLMVLPLLRGDKTIGVMRVGSFRKDYFDQKHLDLGLLIAGEAAAVVEAAVLTRRLSETAEQLKKSNRIKDEFISTVSHEFKTPL
ncbi:MAG TPA: GAF domain-containing protein, partial [Elusimicrobiota bacterium]|nr:GAF domain-containing protein [Elusimicrobiota bacterium]